MNLNKTTVAVVDKSGLMTVQEIPIPVPGEYGALCKMLYGATCTGTDQHILKASLPWFMDYPLVLGHESIGQVIAVGNKVRNLKVGDLVTRVGMREEDCRAGGLGCGWGGFASYGVAMDYRAMEADGVDRAKWAGYRVNQVLPPDFDSRAATMMITWRETLSFLNRLGVKEGSSVVALGTGSVGLSLVQLSKALGASHIAAVGGERNAERAKRAGADFCCDYRASDWGKALSEYKNDFDFVVDSVASRDGVNIALRSLKSGGICSIYGIVTEPDETPVINPTAARAFTYIPCGYDEAETHEQVVALVQAKKLDATIWLELDEAYDLTDIHAAFDAIREKRRVKSLVKLS